MPRILVSFVTLGALVALAASAASPAVQAQGGYRLFAPTIHRMPRGYPGTPTLTASSAASEVVLTWSAVPGAELYAVWYSSQANFAGAQGVYRGPATQVRHTVAPGTHYYRVQAVNAWGASVSQTVGVVVAAPTPAPPPPTPIANVCDAIQGVSYGSLPIVPPPSDRPAHLHADLNLAMRGYRATSGTLGLVDYGGDRDPQAPQLYSLFGDSRTPVFRAVYQVYDWDWGRNTRGGPIENPAVTLLGMATTPGEVLRLPAAGYDIGRGYQALVLYATESQITLKYTGEDNVVYGYTVHVENVCVEPRLLALYREWNAAGRGELPALRNGQPFGRARGSEILVAIRDSGSFMDPRSRKDWWAGR
jgi:hypothetical protein